MAELERIPQKEVTEAREYWASQGRSQFYEAAQHWRRFLATEIAAYKPASVLEFGCNVGRNLVEIRRLLPDATLRGLDVNSEAVEFGRSEHGLELQIGGEEHLSELPDDCFDIVFTVSVLDHIPDVGPAFNELARIGKTIIFLEPCIGAVQRTDLPTDTAALTRVPYTYSWDYLELSDQLGKGWNWRWRPYPLSLENMGPHYWLIEGSRERVPEHWA